MAIFNSYVNVYQRVPCAPDRGRKLVNLWSWTSDIRPKMLKKVQDWNEGKTWKTTRDVVCDVVCVRYKVWCIWRKEKVCRRKLGHTALELAARLVWRRQTYVVVATAFVLSILFWDASHQLTDVSGIKRVDTYLQPNQHIFSSEFHMMIRHVSVTSWCPTKRHSIDMALTSLALTTGRTPRKKDSHSKPLK
jgi:hypothetical protein